MTKSLFDKTTRIAYNTEDVEQIQITELQPHHMLYKDDYKIWLRSYTVEDKENIKAIITDNNLDNFLNVLISNELETNKVIELEDVLFISLHIPSTKEKPLKTKPLIFILTPSFVWSIQNTNKEYFDWIEQRLLNRSGLAMSKQADYLLGLMIKTVIDSYDEVVAKHAENSIYQADIIDLRPTPEFMQEIENFKQELFILKKSALSLHDSITKIMNTEWTVYICCDEFI